MKRYLFLAHRWLGLLGCVLIVLWFATGFVMMYVPYPELLESERLARAAPIERHQVRITPAQALLVARQGVSAQAQTERLRLIQTGPHAVYAVLLPHAGWIGVDASSGEQLRVTRAVAASVGEYFAGVKALSAAPVGPDQWSMQSNLDPHRPLWAVHMADGGVHYLSGRTGEVLRDTSRSERAWNWVGSVVHWIYPTILRRDARLWHWVVVIASSYALIVALLGTTIGLMRLRWRDRERRSPYADWLRWHHLLGLGCAVFMLAWLASGLLSMNPGDVFSDRSISASQSRAWRGASFDDVSVRRALSAPLPPQDSPMVGAAVEFEWWPDGEPEFDPSRGLREGPGVRVTERHDRTTQQLWRRAENATDWSAHEVTKAEIVRRLGHLAGPAVSIERLTADLYHYGRFEPAPAIWRVHLGDAAATWLHVDAHSGELLARLDRSNRVERWTYHGLHSWDFAVLLHHRPLWDLLMLPALASGFLFSITSVVVAARRLVAMRRRNRSRADASAHGRWSQATES